MQISSKLSLLKNYVSEILFYSSHHVEQNGENKI
jgi:hypothetical protein